MKEKTEDIIAKLKNIRPYRRTTGTHPYAAKGAEELKRLLRENEELCDLLEDVYATLEQCVDIINWSASDDVTWRFRLSGQVTDNMIAMKKVLGREVG